jgi:hypothetical protein
VLPELERFDPPPSCIVQTGGGVHAYWWLQQPTVELQRAAALLRAIRQHLRGDALSVAQSLRLPGTLNTKPQRYNSLCTLLELNTRRFHLSDFRGEPAPQCLPTLRSVTPAPTAHAGGRLNPALLRAVCDTLYQQYGGYRRRSGVWIAARCPFPHTRDAPGQHFSFQPAIGLGVCLGKHGRLRLTTLCAALGITPAHYGGLFIP